MHRPRRPSMRRLGVGLVALSLATTLGLGGCAGDDQTQPTLPTVNFSPKLVIEIDDHKITFVKGPRGDDGFSLLHPAVTGGSVIEVANHGPGPHRLQGDNEFDTGIMQAGERTTIVLTNDTTAPKDLTITDPGDPSIRVVVTVNPRSA